MSGTFVQDAIVALVAVSALAYLLWRRFGRRSRGGCPDCPGCAPQPGGAREPPLVTIDAPERRPR